MLEGMIGKKIKMTQTYKNTILVPVTAIEAGPCVVTQIKTMEKDGYSAVQLGFSERKKAAKAQKGQLTGTGKFTYLREFPIDEKETLQTGQKIDVSLFKAGDIVDIIGTSKGKGFAGVVKRHHFHGGPKTHGCSDRLRAPGAIGSTTTPGRVFKNMRMAGHMGDDQVTAPNLEVIESDPERNILLIKGSVPGASNGMVLIRKSRKGR